MSCQPKNRKCRNPLQGQVKDYQEWLKASLVDDKLFDELSALIDQMTPQAKEAKAKLEEPPSTPYPSKLKQTGKNNGTHEDFPNIADGFEGSAAAVASKLGLTQDESEKVVQAISVFTGGLYGAIRDAERTDEMIAGLEDLKAPKALQNSPKNLQGYVDSINRFLGRAPRYEGSISRGMNFESQDDLDAFISAAQGENGITLDAMSSFSSSPDVARKFAIDYSSGDFGVVMNVASNKSGSSIRPFSRFQDEDEVLVPRGTRYRVRGVRKEESNGRVLYVVDMDED